MLDLAEFATLDLHELRADFIVGRIDGRVHIISNPAHLRELAEVEIAINGLRSASRRETKRDVSLSKASLRAIEHLLVRYFADHWLRGSTPQTHIATDFPVDRMNLLNFIKMIAHTSLG